MVYPLAIVRIDDLVKPRLEIFGLGFAYVKPKIKRQVCAMQLSTITG